MADNNNQVQYAGYLQKKCVLVYWLKGSKSSRESVPKVWKYVTRYFFVIGDTLCYTKSKREQEKKKKYKVVLSLSLIKDMSFTHRKISILMASGQKIILKSSSENITGWVAFLVPFRDNAAKSNTINNNIPTHVSRNRRETFIKYPSPASVSAPSLLSFSSSSIPPYSNNSNNNPGSAPATPTFVHIPSNIPSLPPTRKLPHSSSSSLSSLSSSPATTPRNGIMIIDERMPWKESGTIRPYKPHESCDAYVPIHEKDLLRLRSSSKSPCTSSGSLVSSWSMNNIAEWDDHDSGVSDVPTMSWDEWDAIFIKSQSLENVSHLSQAV